MDGRSLLRKFNVLDTRPPDNESGLVGWWTFDDGTATDFSGNQQNGTLSGTTKPTRVSGIIGNALSFDGSTSFVDCTNSSVLNPAQMTVSVWVKFASLANAYTAIVSRNDGAAHVYQLFVKSNGKLAVYVTGTNYDGTGTNTLVTGVWYHLALTVTSSTIVGYVNGLQDHTPVGGGTFGAFSANTTIGEDSVNAGRFMNGLIDDVRIYSRVLGPDEIYALYAQGLAYGQGQPEGELPALRPALASTIQRRTLSALGTHIGSRQMQG